jgi:RNA recognition motif-containing protein
MSTTVGLLFENVPLSLKTEDIRQLFEPFGTIQTCFLATRLSGKSLGFGYVLYSTRAEAERAVQALDGLVLMPGHTLRVHLHAFTVYSEPESPPHQPQLQ